MCRVISRSRISGFQKWVSRTKRTRKACAARRNTWLPRCCFVKVMASKSIGGLSDVLCTRCWPDSRLSTVLRTAWNCSIKSSMDQWSIQIPCHLQWKAYWMVCSKKTLPNVSGTKKSRTTSGFLKWIGKPFRPNALFLPSSLSCITWKTSRISIKNLPRFPWIRKAIRTPFRI